MGKLLDVYRETTALIAFVSLSDADECIQDDEKGYESKATRHEVEETEPLAYRAMQHKSSL